MFSFVGWPADALENFGRILWNRVELDWSYLPRLVGFCCASERCARQAGLSHTRTGNRRGSCPSLWQGNRGSTRSLDEPVAARMRGRWRHPGAVPHIAEPVIGRVFARPVGSCGLLAGNIISFCHPKDARETAPHQREGSPGTAFVAEQCDGGSAWLSPSAGHRSKITDAAVECPGQHAVGGSGHRSGSAHESQFMPTAVRNHR